MRDKSTIWRPTNEVALAESPSTTAVAVVDPTIVELGASAPPPPTLASPPELVSPPSDAELTWYLGSQKRWVHIITLLSFALAASSLIKFSLESPWLYPLLAVLAVSAAGSLLSLISGMNKRRDTKESHLALVDNWQRTTAAGDYPSVDVFLPSCGEDIAVLRNTFTHVGRMEWAGDLNIWVLDDADKREVKDLAAEFGFHYRVRPNRGFLKKAGNLQYGFGQSTGSLIVIFDADFCPRTDFLAHTVPYMVDDPGIAILQTPQFFETRGAMTWLERAAGSTQELFYRWVQPSRDRAGAAICVGTCAVYRRSALEKTNGFAQIEHSEDVHTGMMLLRAGYSVRYVAILVSRGLCPTDLAGFLNQQYRWCNGSITLLRSGQASKRPLTIRQRLAFWSGFMYYISTALNVFMLHVPGMIMVVFLASSVRATNFIPFLAGAWVYTVLMPRVSKSRWRYEVMRVQMAYSFAHALAIVHKLTGRTKGWVATGAVGKSSSLAKTIALIGIVTIGVNLSVSWGWMLYDVSYLGWHQFWPMAIFLLGYSWVGIPLLVAFIKVRIPKKTIPATIAIEGAIA
jgi:cellulose synthase (UDP-forming)